MSGTRPESSVTVAVTYTCGHTGEIPAHPLFAAGQAALEALLPCPTCRAQGDPADLLDERWLTFVPVTDADHPDNPWAKALGLADGDCLRIRRSYLPRDLQQAGVVILHVCGHRTLADVSPLRRSTVLPKVQDLGAVCPDCLGAEPVTEASLRGLGLPLGAPRRQPPPEPWTPCTANVGGREVAVREFRLAMEQKDPNLHFGVDLGHPNPEVTLVVELTPSGERLVRSWTQEQREWEDTQRVVQAVGAEVLDHGWATWEDLVHRLPDLPPVTLAGLLAGLVVDHLLLEDPCGKGWTVNLSGCPKAVNPPPGPSFLEAMSAARSALARTAGVPEDLPLCRDGGTCHHLCKERGESCFRERYCGPFTDWALAHPEDPWARGVYPQDGEDNVQA